jgi:leucyl aminopeptidase
LEVREAKKIENLLKIDKLGYFSSNLDEGNKLMRIINGLELGRIVARDIGSADPERMNPQNVHNYVKEQFESTEIKVC